MRNYAFAHFFACMQVLKWENIMPVATAEIQEQTLSIFKLVKMRELLWIFGGVSDEQSPAH